MAEDTVNIEIRPLRVAEALIYWVDFEPFLQKVVDISHGEVTLKDIRGNLESGRELIVAVFQGDEIIGCCVLSITIFDTGKKVLQMPYCGGRDMHLWIHEGFEVVKEIARSQDCTHIRGCGRHGWNKVLPELKKIRTVYEAEL